MTAVDGIAEVTAVCVVHELLPEPTNPDQLTAIGKARCPPRRSGRSVRARR